MWGSREVLRALNFVFATYLSTFSHRVLFGPFFGSAGVLVHVSLVDLSDFWHEGVIGVGVSQQGTDRKKHFRDGKCWGPLVFQDIQADGTVGVDVWMINSSREVNLGWLEWVVSWEVNVQEENSSGKRRVLWSHDGGLPVELIFLINWASRAVCWWIFSKINKFLLDSLKSHILVNTTL